MRRRSIETIRKNTSNIFGAVRDELSGNGADIGYRTIHKPLKSKGCICRRDDVRHVVKQLIPDGVKLRKHRRLHRRGYIAGGSTFM